MDLNFDNIIKSPFGCNGFPQQNWIFDAGGFTFEKRNVFSGFLPGQGVQVPSTNSAKKNPDKKTSMLGSPLSFDLTMKLVFIILGLDIIVAKRKSRRDERLVKTDRIGTPQSGGWWTIIWNRYLCCHQGAIVVIRDW